MQHYEEMLRVVQNFDHWSVIGHLDHIKRYDPLGPWPDVNIRDIVAEILEEAIRRDKGIELNTSSVRYGLSDLTPSTEILRLYRDLGGRILTLGSDSHKPEHLGAQSAISSTFPWAQSFTGSSGAKADSTVLHEQITRGRAGDLPLYLEWSTDPSKGRCLLGIECSHVRGTPGCRLDDRELIRLANPTVGRIRPDGRGLTFEAIEQERNEQPNPLIFARERLGWHEAFVDTTAAVFTEDAWSALRRPKSRIESHRTLALQVSPNQDWSAVVAGGYNDDGQVHLEVPSKWTDLTRSARTYARWSGTDRVVPWVRKYLRKRTDETVLVLLAGSAAMALLPALKRLTEDPKLGQLTIVITPEAQFPAACGHVQNLVANERLVHVGDPELQASFLAVGKRMVGEKAFVWSPRASSGDITAANAATLAAWWLEQGEDYDVGDSVG